jgi:hypothetical protein
MLTRGRVGFDGRRSAYSSASVCGRIMEDACGQSLVEFALLLPVMLLLFFGTVEFGRLWFTRLTVRHAVVEATRFAVTGNRLPDPDTGDPLSRVESIEQQLRNSAYSLDIEDIDIDPDDGGGPEDVVRVTVTYAYHYSLPGLKNRLPTLRFDVSAAMRNEPYFETEN